MPSDDYTKKTVEQEIKELWDNVYRLTKEVKKLASENIPLDKPVKPALGVKVSYAVDLQKRREEINKIPFDDLKLLDDDGNEIQIKQDIREEWKFTGLNNTDYINTCFYKQGFMGESDSPKSV